MECARFHARILDEKDVQRRAAADRTFTGRGGVAYGRTPSRFRPRCASSYDGIASTLASLGLLSRRYAAIASSRSPHASAIRHGAR
jgi:hypothetical protein